MTANDCMIDYPKRDVFRVTWPLQIWQVSDSFLRTVQGRDIDANDRNRMWSTEWQQLIPVTPSNLECHYCYLKSFEIKYLGNVTCTRITVFPLIEAPASIRTTRFTDKHYFLKPRFLVLYLLLQSEIPGRPTSLAVFSPLDFPRPPASIRYPACIWEPEPASTRGNTVARIVYTQIGKCTWRMILTAIRNTKDFLQSESQVVMQSHAT